MILRVILLLSSIVLAVDSHADDQRDVLADMRDGMEIRESWIQVVESATEKYAESKDEITQFVSDFSDSEYTSVVRMPSGSVFGKIGSGPHELIPLEYDAAWIQAMFDLDLLAVKPLERALTISVIPDTATQDHQFTFQLVVGADTGLAQCRAGFETVACGTCISPISESLGLLVGWNSWEFLGALESDDSEAPLALLACVEAGNEELAARFGPNL